MTDKKVDEQVHLVLPAEESATTADATPGSASPDTDNHLGEAKTKILARLKELNVTNVEVCYEGCGDSGCIESITASKEDGTAVEIDQESSEAIEEYVYDRLPGGWEINDGSYGTVRFDVASKTVYFDHCTRYTQESFDGWEE